MFILTLVTIIFGLLGFLLVLFIRHKKKNKEPMVCPLKADCGAVVNSRFAKIFGVDITLLGMLYYVLIVVTYTVLLLAPALAIAEVSFVLSGITTVAFLFSLYLVGVQAFALKQWCTWCLLSALICVGIFTFSMIAVPIDLVPLLTEYKQLIVLVHAIAAAIGVGTVTLTDVFFFRFLKDYRISKPEAEIMHVLSDVIWVALGLLVFTGIGLFIQNSEVLIQTPKFVLKMLIVIILIINGVLLNRVVHPRLMDITFGESHIKEKGEMHYLRRLSFAFGALSLISWYSVFILGWFRTISLSLPALFGIYLGIVIIAVTGSQYVDYLISKRKL